MANDLANGWQTSGKPELSHRFDSGSTLTDERTNGLTDDHQDPGAKSLVPDLRKPVDKWVIRKRFSFMYGAPGMYWRVSHPSLPEYFGRSLHLYSFGDALSYALDRLSSAPHCEAEKTE